MAIYLRSLRVETLGIWYKVATHSNLSNRTNEDHVSPNVQVIIIIIGFVLLCSIGVARGVRRQQNSLNYSNSEGIPGKKLLVDSTLEIP